MSLNLIIIFSLFYCYLLDCIPNKNCFKTRGECINNTCICYEEYWTLKSYWKNSKNKIFCNYERQSRIKPLILELFFPGIGHLIMKKYKLCIIKLTLLFTSIILILIGFHNYKNGNNKIESKKKRKNEEEKKLVNKNINNKEDQKDIQKDIVYFSDEGKEESLNESAEIHQAIHVEKPIPCINKFLVKVVGSTIIGFCIMHIIDLINYGFAFYTDENDVPFL